MRPANYTRTDQGASRVVVVGRADSSGSAAYNVRLSERRAKAVADALVSAGVDQSKRSRRLEGRKPTGRADGEGVKEPLNRHATIDIAP
jgi:flagellar motor protein MotB